MSAKNTLLRLVLWTAIPLLLHFSGYGHDVDTTKMKKVYDYTQDRSYIAKRTAMKSALIPAWGQYTNKQYIKIPFIYLSLGVAGYFIADNYKNYTLARQAYLYRLDNDDDTEVEQYENSSTTYIQSQKSTYREYLDYSVLAAALIYTLNILDAAVFSHLQEFDVSSDLTLHPTLKFDNLTVVSESIITPSLGLTVRIK